MNADSFPPEQRVVIEPKAGGREYHQTSFQGLSKNEVSGVTDFSANEVLHVDDLKTYKQMLCRRLREKQTKQVNKTNKQTTTTTANKQIKTQTKLPINSIYKITHFTFYCLVMNSAILQLNVPV